MSKVWELDLPLTKKAILLSLADHANDEGAHVYPSVALTAAKCSVAERTVQTALRELREEGILVEVRKGGGRGKTTEYRIDLKGAADSPFFVQRAQEADEKGASDDRNPAGAAPEPSVEPPTSESKTAPSSRVEQLVNRASKHLAPSPDETNRRPQWTATEEGLIANLREMDPAWDRLTWGAMNRLVNLYGHVALTFALQDAWEDRFTPASPYAWTEARCKAIAERQSVDEGGLGEGPPSSTQADVEAHLDAARNQYREALDELAER